MVRQATKRTAAKAESNAAVKDESDTKAKPEKKSVKREKDPSADAVVVADAQVKRKQPSAEKKKKALPALNVLACHQPTADDKRGGPARRGGADFTSRKARALSQRMFLVAKTAESRYTSTFSVLGSTGNVYTVTIGQHVSCDCPDSTVPCKHIIFVMVKVLRLPRDSQLLAQQYLLKSEVQDIFAHASRQRVDKKDVACDAVKKALSGEGDNDEGAAKARNLGEDCPVCYDELPKVANSTVSTCATCRNALHASCLTTWKQHHGASATCPVCRSSFEADSGKANVNTEGYVNVQGMQAGVRATRDASTYKSWDYDDYRYRRHRRYRYDDSNSGDYTSGDDDSDEESWS